MIWDINTTYKNNIVFSSDTQYSEWFQVPDDKSTVIDDIMENKRFQIKTHRGIGAGSDIRWTMIGIGWFTFLKPTINGPGCGGSGELLRDTEPFFLKAGVLTFLKTSTHLKIWFDGAFVATWVYPDSCSMKKPFSGLQFWANGGNKEDTVTESYRYQTGTIEIRI